MNEPEWPRLVVHLGSERLGELERIGPTRYRFEYDAQVVETYGDGAIVLSASLPVRAETYPNASTKPFFEGLLPEGVARGEAARAIGVSESNGFGMLAALGADCAGAVVVLPPDIPIEREGAMRWVDEPELEQLLRELPRHPLGIDLDAGIRLSLGGVQQKLIVTRAPNGAIGQPVGGTPSTHIIKPTQDAYPDLVANETFGLRVAQCVGLPAARAEIRSFGEIETLMVERFDRTIDATGAIVRLHQEDFCQALGVLPAAKYESEGGPSFAQIAELLREVGTARDLRAFALATLINFLLGNSDAHGKNYSLLYDEPGRVRLSPLYDIVSTAVYPGLTTRLAMSVAGLDEPSEIDESAWTRMLSDGGFRPQAAQLGRDVDQIVRCTHRTREVARAEGWHCSLVDEIVTVAETRRAYLAS